MAVGGWLVFESFRLFVKNKTKENFQRSKHLVTEGLYNYSRNPMYLAMIVFLIGLAILSQNPIALIGPLFFFLAVELVFIPFEEEKSEKEFGKKYLEYKKRVRRWL